MQSLIHVYAKGTVILLLHLFMLSENACFYVISFDGYCNFKTMIMS